MGGWAVLLGLLSLAGLSLFLAQLLRRSSALMPLLAVGLAVVYFTLAGCLDVLLPNVQLLLWAGYAWYALCALAFVAVLAGQKGRFWRLCTPGFVLFVVGSLLFVLLFMATQPMLTHWDEFTFWGTAAKATSQNHQLYTTARANLIARTYPPGLIVYTYMMQFFGGFTEAGFVACFAVFYLACFTAAGALWGKKTPALLLFMAALVLLPLFFEVNRPAGQMLWSYAACMADVPMATLFGGTLAFYFAGGEKGTRLLAPLGVLLAALVCLKDMGFALALIALFIIGCDLFFCERKRLYFFRLRRWKGFVLFLGYALAAIAGAFLLWKWYLEAAAHVDRFEIGSYGVPLSQLQLLTSGVAMLFGVGRTPQFQQVLGDMLRAFFTKPVSLLGPGVVVLLLILAILVLAFALATSRRRRLRVLVFAASSLVCFVAFYVFNIFTYAMVFRQAEAAILKDYARYMLPFWMGWLMAALVLLSDAANNEKAVFHRLRLARAASGLASVGLVAVVLAFGSWGQNFLHIPQSLFTVRQQLQGVVQQARNEGMQPQDVVYIISQGDDGSRFYMLGYEMEAERALMYNGIKVDIGGYPVLDDAGNTIPNGNVASTFVLPGSEAMPLDVGATQKELVEFMRLQGCTHLLIDQLDDYILKEFAPLFEDGLAGWESVVPVEGRTRYYQIEWQTDGSCTLLPAKGGAA